MNPQATSRVDLHCHSTASEVSKLGIQRSLGLPECATPPEEVYELAKRRGMDFVTITDHDTISGCLEISDRPDVFVSEELTAWFRGGRHAVHVLCFDITPDDHGWLQEHARDVEACAEYLHAGGIACSLAHPFYAVEAPLTAAHRRRLAELFPVWESRNGSRARELNQPAATYSETRGGSTTGGSDDHAGVDIGRTFTETPFAATPEEFLRHLRDGRAAARGEQGSAAKWAHAAMALATRALVIDSPDGDRPTRGSDPVSVLAIVQRVMWEGNARSGSVGADLGPDDARALLDAFLGSLGLEERGRALIDHMQDDDFEHAALARRARRVHESRLSEAIDRALAGAGDWENAPGLFAAVVEAGKELFQAALPAVPYAPAAAFLGREKAKLFDAEGPPRVALVADGIAAMHGVSHTVERIRELGVPGYEVEVVGTDGNVDRRLPSVREFEVPLYPGLELGLPSIPALVEILAEGRYDLLHVTAPGPAGLMGGFAARIMELPVLGSWHTEFGAYVALRSGAEFLGTTFDRALAAIYGQCERVLSPSPAADASLARIGVQPERIGRWGRGVDTRRFDPSLSDPDSYPGEIKVLYAGRLTKEKGIELLADAFLHAREREPRLHLLVAGGGPEEDLLRERLGESATFLGWLEGEDLPRAYASADIFLFCSSTDTFGQVLVEAGASGLPVVAVAEGGPASVVLDGKTGRLCEPEPEALAAAVLQMAASPAWRAKLGRQALEAARARTWEVSMQQLASGYDRALGMGAEEPRIRLRAA